MASPSIQPLSDFENFLAQDFSVRVMDAAVVLAFLRKELSRDEFIRMARPLFLAIQSLAAESACLPLRDADAGMEARWLADSLEIPATLFRGAGNAPL